MESGIIKDFERRILQAEGENNLERAWVLDRCLGSFKGILELKTAEQHHRLFQVFRAFIDLDILLNKRNLDVPRLQAAQRILAEQIKRPIHRGRWNFVKDELDRLAKQKGRSRDLVISPDDADQRRFALPIVPSAPLDTLNREFCNLLDGSSSNGAATGKMRTMSAAARTKIAALLLDRGSPPELLGCKIGYVHGSQ